ncbi:MAG: EI24 domain-containing protein [Betaproteobacteria bacterium]|nr:EI24 domain-containing protein [Betaproteobacteria bacterium]
MSGVVQALFRSFATLGRGRVWLLLLGPAVLALVAWSALAIFVLDGLIATFLDLPPMTWLTTWGAVWLAHLFAVLGGWLLILAAAYLTAILLAAILVLPLLLKHVAATDYPELARMGKDSLTAATWNSVSAALLFIAGWLLTLPLWLVPGLGLLLPLFWMAWLNRRTFAYDALAVHATDEEWRGLRRQHAAPLLMLGVTLALLAHLPLIGLLAPTLAALAYIHYTLEALRQLRQGAIVTIVGEKEAGL